MDGSGQGGPLGHRTALDGVRGIAFLAVLLFHAVEVWRRPELGAIGDGLQVVMRAGWIGVDLFFVLSGLLITGLLLDAGDGPRPLRRFLLRRSLRIFPLYFLYLALCFLVLVATSGVEALLTVDRVAYWVYAQNIAIALHSYDAFKPLAHLWSLAVEEQFYLFWPLLVLLLPRRWLLPTVVAVAVFAMLVRVALVLHGTYPVLVYVSTPTRMDLLAAGAALAILLRAPEGVARVRRWAPSVALCGLASVIGLMVVRGGYEIADPWVRGVGFSANLVACLGVVAWAATRPVDSGVVPGGVAATGEGWMSHPVLVRLGQRSYAGYLVHWPLVLVGHAALVQSGVPAGWGIAALAVGALAVSLLVAEAAWRWVERPIARWRDRWAP